MTALLDPRDGSGDLVGYFPAGFAETEYLNSADVMGAGNGPYGPIMWGVEVKTLSDVIGSMQSGRLVEQLGKMQEDYDWRYLLIEGTYKRSSRGTLQKLVQRGAVAVWNDVMFGNKQKMTYNNFNSWLLSVLTQTGTYLLRTHDRQETADTIVAVARRFDKEWDDSSSTKVFRTVVPPGLVIPTTAMLVIKDLAEGVGWEKAAAGAQHFKTAAAAVNATADEWREVPGIDKVLAQRLVEGASEPHKVKRRSRRRVKQ